MNSVQVPVAGHRVFSREVWIRERIALLAEEKELMHQRDALTGRVRDLPWVKVDKPYTFDSPTGSVSLADLFGDRSQLIVYHFMFDGTWSQGCKSCSFIADHYNGIVVHLAHRDISFVTVSKAPIGHIEPFRKRMGWTFPWVSGANTDFGRDFGVSFTDEELAKDAPRGPVASPRSCGGAFPSSRRRASPSAPSASPAPGTRREAEPSSGTSGMPSR